MLDPSLWKPGVPVRVSGMPGGPAASFTQSDAGFSAVALWRERLGAGEPAADVAVSLWGSEFGCCGPRVSWVSDVADGVDEYRQLLRAAVDVVGGPDRLVDWEGDVAYTGAPGELDLVLRFVLLQRAVDGVLTGGPLQGAANRMLESFAPRFGRGVLSMSAGRPLLSGVSGFDAALYGVWLWLEHSRLCALCGSRFVRQFDGPYGFAKTSAMYCSRRCAMVQASRMYRSRMADGASGERPLVVELVAGDGSC